jgi:hypothetical protein
MGVVEGASLVYNADLKKVVSLIHAKYSEPYLTTKVLNTTTFPVARRHYSKSLLPRASVSKIEPGYDKANGHMPAGCRANLLTPIWSGPCE